MCHYRFYIYVGCGHSTFAATPVKLCARATSNNRKRPKEGSPYQSTADVKDTSTDAASDLNTGSRPEGARPPPQRSLLSTPVSPKEKNTKPSLKRPRSAARGKNTQLEPCNEGLIHPLHTVRIETLCPGCAADRDARLEALAMFSTEIKLDPARWQWKYRASGEGPSQMRQHVDGEAEPKAADAEPKAGAARGVWSGANWMKDWRG
ncbi:hypothetical protein CC86DRAFT_366722 [Ophiobolus disseminans]|uniref:Uncharacterized protein n=1 Tax=Ophiobolus disseminans TaxID=1469910 RepID=A0A6A7AEM5_9PLEO|nr:hypothetical protein CC86DRAFT_366722 [Ophiobolus disseminans]